MEIIGGCASNTGSEITIGGERQTPGSPPSSGSPKPIGNPGPDAEPWYPPPEFHFDDCLRNWDSYIGCFRAREEDAPAEGEDEPAMPAITISDLARFAPDEIVISGEPENIGIAGLPLNFVAAASPHTVDGTLFGHDVSVRFSPSRYEFHYGDGESASTGTGGASWAALGQEQFSQTATSHTYREPGTYAARVEVRYTAEVNLGVGWFRVPGELASSGPAQEICVFEAHTALVAYTCDERPGAPGC